MARVAGAWRLRSSLVAAAWAWFGLASRCVWLAGYWLVGWVELRLRGNWTMVAWLGWLWHAYYLNLT